MDNTATQREEAILKALLDILEQQKIINKYLEVLIKDRRKGGKPANE